MSGGAAYRLRVPTVGPAGCVVFEGAAARKIRSVLRLDAGDWVVAVDSGGTAHRVRLLSVDGRKVVGEAVDRLGALARPARPVLLAVAAARRLDEAVEKAVEAGAVRIVVFRAARSAARAAGADRAARWRRIAETAAAQCGRADVPEIDGPVSFDEALRLSTSFGPAYLLHAPDAGPPPADLAALLGARRGPVALLVGPEGGFASAEVEAARSIGVTPVGLGPMTLRVETAAAIAVWAAARADA